MTLFKSFLCLFSGTLLFFSACAGDLTDFSRELDFIELSFAHAALQPATSENRLHVERRIMDFHTRLLAFYRKLQRQKVPGIPNFLAPAMTLKRTFESIKYTGSDVRIPRFKGTGMSHYYREYQRYLRDKNMGEKKSRSERKYPTLKTVNIDSYKAWLDRTAQNYIQSLKRYSSRSSSGSKRKKRSSSRGLPGATRQQLEDYVLQIVKLRLCFVQLAQNKFYKE